MRLGHQVKPGGDDRVARVAVGDLRPQKIVPRPQDVYDDDDGDDLLTQRQHDVKVLRQVSRAVEPRRFEQLIWQSVEEALEQENRQDLSAGNVRQNEHPIAVEQAELFDEKSYT